MAQQATGPEVTMSVLLRCTVAVVAMLSMLAVTNGCNKLKSIPGNIAGVVIDSSGVGQGYITVQLIDQTTLQVMYQMTTEDSGGYFFDKVEPGKYTVAVLGMGQVPYSADVTEVNLPPGKTLDITITATPAPKKEK